MAQHPTEQTPESQDAAPQTPMQEWLAYDAFDEIPDGIPPLEKEDDDEGDDD